MQQHVLRVLHPHQHISSAEVLAYRYSHRLISLSHVSIIALTADEMNADIALPSNARVLARCLKGSLVLLLVLPHLCKQLMLWRPIYWVFVLLESQPFV